MAEKSFPWTGNGTGDGTSGGYTALEWSEMWRRIFHGGEEASGGVLRGHGNELAVSGSASPLAVNTGAAMVYGKHYYNSASLNLAVTTPVVGTTGGHVILRLDWAAQTVRAVAVRNTDGVAAIPSLTQSLVTQWEIRLATFTITTGGVITLTDARTFAYFGSKVKTAMLDLLAVTTAVINDLAVTTGKIAANAVTFAKMVQSAAGLSVVGRSANSAGDFAEIVAANDGEVLRRSGTSLGFGTVATAGITDEAVTQPKLGDGIPFAPSFKGGDQNFWNTVGTTTYTTQRMKMAMGAHEWTGAAAANGSGAFSIPEALASRGPLVFLQPVTPDGATPDIIMTCRQLQVTSNTTIDYRWKSTTGATYTSVRFFWVIFYPAETA